jgi:hypothetical protein
LATRARPFIKTVTIGSDISFSLETDDRLIAEPRQVNALAVQCLRSTAVAN